MRPFDLPHDETSPRIETERDMGLTSSRPRGQYPVRQIINERVARVSGDASAQEGAAQDRGVILVGADADWHEIIDRLGGTVLPVSGRGGILDPSARCEP